LHLAQLSLGCLGCVFLIHCLDTLSACCCQTALPLWAFSAKRQNIVPHSRTLVHTSTHAREHAHTHSKRTITLPGKIHSLILAYTHPCSLEQRQGHTDTDAAHGNKAHQIDPRPFAAAIPSFRHKCTCRADEMFAANNASISLECALCTGV